VGYDGADRDDYHLNFRLKSDDLAMCT